MVADEGFVLIGAGLPRTGTMSTRAALKIILKGNIYHMAVVVAERPDHHWFWRKVIKGEANKSEWRKVLSDFRGGVDYPISFFYKELMEVYPNAKVLLTTRDPVKWYESVKNAIYKLQCTMQSWPCTWFLSLIGRSEMFQLVDDMSSVAPKCSSSGLGMFGAVAAGEKAAVQLWHDHVTEVKKMVPAEKLLIWEVKEGWEPLCKFLDVPVPQEPFPRVNDTKEMEKNRKTVLYASWLLIVLIPMALVSTAWYCSLSSPQHILVLAGAYFGFIQLFVILAKWRLSKFG